MSRRSFALAAALFAGLIAIGGPASATMIFSAGTFKLLGSGGGGIDDQETFAVDASSFTGLTISFKWRTLCESGCDDQTENADRFFVSADGYDLNPAGGYQMGGAIAATPGDPGPWQHVTQSISFLDGAVFDLSFALMSSTAGENVKVSRLVVEGAGGAPLIPEPATLSLFGVGLAAIGLGRRRRARSVPA